MLPDLLATPEQVLAEALRQSIGSPARADISNQATDRLTDGLLIIPREPAARLLGVMKRPTPTAFNGLVIGSEGMEAPGIIQFIPAGFIDSDVIQSWTPDDILASLQTTVERGNTERVRQNLPELEVRRWIQPPRYNPQTHQLSWAALIVHKSATRDADGELTYHAVGFGREGYVHLTVVSSVEKADDIRQMVDGFLLGLHFLPGKTYDDAVPADHRAADGLAGAMEIDSLRTAASATNFWATDTVIPVAGGIVATIGALSLFIYIQRHLRRLTRQG